MSLGTKKSMYSSKEICLQVNQIFSANQHILKLWHLIPPQKLTYYLFIHISNWLPTNTLHTIFTSKDTVRVKNEVDIRSIFVYFIWFYIVFFYFHTLKRGLISLTLLFSAKVYSSHSKIVWLKEVLLLGCLQIKDHSVNYMNYANNI